MNTRGRPKEKKAEPMKIVTINLPKLYLVQIEILTEGENRTHTSRSAVIREALKEFLQKEIIFHKNLVEDVESYLEATGKHLIGEA